MNILTPADGLKAPGHCVFTHDIDGPFLDTERYLNEVDPYGYVHVPFVEEMGRAVGMVPGFEVDALKERLVALENDLAEAMRLAASVTKLEEAEAELREAVSA